MNMPSSEYNRIYREVEDWRGSKEALQKLYDEIVYKYDDGREIIRRIDSMHNHKFSGMDLH